VKLKLIHPGKG